MPVIQRLATAALFVNAALPLVALAQTPEPLSPECDCLLGGAMVRVIDLRQAGFEGVQVWDLNNHGQVVLSMNRPGERGNGYVWRDGAVTALARPPRPGFPGAQTYTETRGRAINDDGVIVGHAVYAGFPRAAVWPSADAAGVAHYEQDDDPMVFAPRPASYTDIAPSGATTGESFAGGQGAIRALGGGRYEILPFDTCADGRGVNSQGVVVGTSGLPDSLCRPQATLWEADGQRTVLRGWPSTAEAMNDAGQVLISIDGSTGFLLSAGELGRLDMDVVDINESGVVGGGDGGRAMLWFDGQYLDVGAAIEPGEGWELLGPPVAINDRCWMVGLGVRDGEMNVPYLAMPIGCPPACPADLDGDGTLTLFDFLAFQNLFDTGDPLADFDGDGELTLFDFLAFQNAFDAGCP